LPKAKPGELAYAFGRAVGAVHHIFCELFMNMTGIKMRHVAGIGAGRALRKTTSSQVHVPGLFCRCGAGRCVDQNSGQLKALRRHDPRLAAAKPAWNVADARGKAGRHRLRGQHLGN